MGVLDRFGNEVERPRVRMSLGFVRKELPAGEPETLTGIAATPKDGPREWMSGADGVHEEPR